ncbi:MAG: glycosyltransferase family 4 protein [Paenibacillaceae bacterium]|nr:glycosyltransferase family 4 protein [Paenibacillaceae bacterium]
MNSNVVIFGTGIFYERRKNTLPKEVNIIAFIDNNNSLQGKYIENISVYAPHSVSELNYDVIILASLTPIEMKNQLILLGVPSEKIMFWEEFVSSKTHGLVTKYEAEKDQGKKRALIILPFINYTGGSLAAIYAAIALKDKGYYVVLSAPAGNEDTILEINSYKINVWLCTAIPYIEEAELEWIQEFDFVMAIALQSILCVNRISKRKPVFWWLHEHSTPYNEYIKQYGNLIDDTAFTNVKIFAVSDIARSNFAKYYLEPKVEILPFGLPDFYVNGDIFHEKIVISIIGKITSNKNQKELIYALKKLPLSVKDKLECWIIGSDGGKKYREEVNDIIKDFNQIKILGEMSRNEIEKVFQQIDIVVCTSLEETMSIAIVEGMMNQKICITNTNTGIAEFIQNNENGFIYEAGNLEDLLLKLTYIIQNIESLNYIRKNARNTYERYFSMNKFGDTIQTYLCDHMA